MSNYPPGMVDGDPNAPILVVGMAPGREELVAGRPFVGPSGRLLWSCAQRAGFSRADCYTINTIGEVQEDGSSPSERQFDLYWDLFDEAVRQSSARVVLCLGRDAFWRLTGTNGGILDWRGYILEPSDCRDPLVRHTLSTVPYKTNTKTHKKGDPRSIKIKVRSLPILPASLQHIIPTVHPSYVMRTGYKATAVLAYDIARVKRALDGQLAFSDLTYDTVPGPIGTGPLALDIETSRSIIGHEWINRIGVSTKAGTWTAPWNSETKGAIREHIHSGRLLIGHNLAYDLPRLEADGVPSSGYLYDTMYACQTLQPDLPKGLNFVASLYLDTKRWKHKSESEPELYNALDVAQTFRLYQITKEELASTGQTAVFENMMRGLPVLIEATKTGLKLDPARREAWLVTLYTQEGILRSQWEALHPNISIGSNPQLKKLFYQDLKLKIQFGDDRKPSTDETAIRRLQALYPDPHIGLSYLLAWRKVNKLRTTYAEVKLSGDGCVHPSYTATAKDKDERGKGMAGTGRIQARDPNIMQLPKEARKLYVPHDPKNIFIEFDYVQAELRVVAAVSGDAMLMQRLGGPDIHQLHADMWGCSRKEAKNVTYATMYGAGKEKLQTLFTKYGLTKTQKECQHLLDQFYSTYPTVKGWRDSVVAKVQAERRVVNPFGRARYFWAPNKDIPAALDFIPQSTVADIMWYSLPRISQHAKDFGGKLLTIVHDSYLFEIPKLRARSWAATAASILEMPYHNIARGFYLPVSWGSGPNWGEIGGDLSAEEEAEEADAQEALLS